MLFLAPMASITDLPYRLLLKKHFGVDALTSELISSHGIFYQDKKTLKLCEFHEAERPISAQIFGYDLDKLCVAAKILEDRGYDVIDLNLGCPVQKVVQKGAGAGMLRDVPKLFETLEALQKAITIPLSIKIRLGWDETCLNAREVVAGARDMGILRVAIHGRSRSQGYKGQANWELMRAIAQEFPNYVIGNGDIRSLEDYQCARADAPFLGIMIGRAALSYPWIFEEIRQGKHLHVLPEQIVQVLRIYQEYLQMYSPDRLTYIQLRFKKMASWLSYGLPFASKFRADLFRFKVENLAELIQCAEDYFGQFTQDEFSTRSLEAIYHGGEG